MPFKLSQWLRALGRLEIARQNLAAYLSLPKDARERHRRLLDDAVIGIRDIAVYVVNVLLELHGMEPDRAHKTDLRAQELRIAGYLKGDYQKVLEQLERYRKSAQYLDYVALPSTHYSSANARDCLAAVDELIVEARTALLAAGKDPP